MPSKLKIWPSERIDVEDFTYGTSTYAQLLQAFNNKNLIEGVFPQFIKGFGISVADQDVSPGEITVYNGYTIDKVGNLLTAEDSITTSSSITLTGTSTTFYIEILLRESLTSVDDRAIWDSSADAGNGAEFIDNLSTRTAVTWGIVSPVSTTGFEQTANANSVKIPLAILKTDGVGKITVPANTGLVLGQTTSVLVEDLSVAGTVAKVADATLLPSSGNVLLTNVNTGSTELVPVSSIDRVNNIVNFSAGPTGAYPIGSIILDFATARSFIQERTSNTIEFTGAASTHPDKKRRLFTGNELTGRAMYASKYDVTKRNDLNISNLKNYVDFLAAQLREMKLGSPLVGSTPSAIPPSIASTLRYYDYAGSIMGAKEATYTISTNGLGDFNGTDHTPFTAAIAAAVAAGYTSVKLFVKRGTYSFTSSVSPTIDVFIEGETNAFSSNPVLIQNTTDTNHVFNSTGSYIGFKNIKMSQTQSNATTSIVRCAGTGTTIVCDLLDCYLTGARNRAVTYTGANTFKLNLYGTTIESTNSASVLITAESGMLSGLWAKSTISNTNATGDSLVKTLITANLTIDSCTFLHNGTVNTIHWPFVVASSITNSIITNTGAGTTTANSGNCLYLGTTAVADFYLKSNRIYATGTNNNVKWLYLTGCARLAIQDCTFFNTSAVGSSATNFINLLGTVSDLSIKDNSFTTTITGSGVNNYIINKTSGIVDNFNIRGNTFNSGAGAVSIYFNNTEHNGLNISDNFVYGGLKGIWITGGTEPTNINSFFPHITINNNLIHCKGTALSHAGAIQEGIRIEGLEGYTNIKIYSNSIEDLNADSSYGINLEDFDLSGLASVAGTPSISIYDNKIGRVLATAEAIGIRTVNTSSMVKVQNNFINFIKGATSMGIHCGIGEEIQIQGNTIFHTDNNGSSDVTRGIYLTGAVSRYSIDDNILDDIGSTTNTTEIIGIGVIGGSIAVGGSVSRNKINDVENNGITLSAGILLSGNCPCTVVCNNVIKNSGLYSIYGTNTGGSVCSGLVVDGNHITCDANVLAGIRLIGSSSSNGFSHFNVKGNNIISYRTGTSTIGAITIDRAVNFSICNNIVQEASTPTDPTLNSALRIANAEIFNITGNSFRGVSNSDNLTRGSVIFSGSITQFNITGNTFKWTSVNTSTGRELYLPGATFGAISGNFFMGSANFGVKFTIRFDGSSDGVFIASNFFQGNNAAAQVDDGGGTDIEDEIAANPANFAA